MPPKNKFPLTPAVRIANIPVLENATKLNIKKIYTRVFIVEKAYVIVSGALRA